ncbi:hypothetical protein V6N13_040148, partial [Hibiscus sabdariffa]
FYANVNAKGELIAVLIDPGATLVQIVKDLKAKKNAQGRKKKGNGGKTLHSPS